MNGGCDQIVFFGVESWYTAGRSEAWRIFCRPGTSFLSFTRVAIQGLWRADYESRYTKLYRKQVCGPDLSRFTKLSK